MRKLLLFAFCLTPLAHAEKNPEMMILGDWCGKPKHAFHEQFVLSNTANKKEFSSYLHKKPAESGTWQISGKNLFIKSSQNYQYKILMLAPQKLVLLNQTNEKEYYFRCK